jgi:rare lipoprotein A
MPDLSGVGGVTPRFEPPSRIGNKDYEVYGQTYKVWNGINNYVEEGTASWYGPGFHGLYTSNGELYDQEDISAAHKNLPLPSYLKVSNLDNGKTIVVRVNDRGPFHGDRILDLSHGAATRLGLVGPGTAHVRVELVKVPRPANADEIIARHEARTIQLMATSSAIKAEDAARELTSRYGKPFRVVNANQVYRLHVGPLERKEAENMLHQLRGAGYQQAFFIN